MCSKVSQNCRLRRWPTCPRRGRLCWARARSSSGHGPATQSVPAETLEALDAFAATLDGAFCATAVVTVVDRRARTITYSHAGHPPPLVVSGAVATWLDDAAGVPLAVIAGVKRSNQTRSLQPNATLILYTDGLIERRGESLDQGMARLADAAIGCVGASSGQPVADALLQLLLPGVIDDDVVIVVKQLLAPEECSRRMLPKNDWVSPSRQCA